MRILLVTPYFPPSLGGACRMMGLIADSLLADGHHLDVLTLAHGVGGPPVTARGVIDRVPGSGQRARPVAAMGLRLLSVLASRPRYDLIFCGVAYASAVLAYLATRGLPTPYLVYSHGEDATVVESSKAKRRLLTLALRGAAHLFANSAFSRAALLRLGAPAERTEVLHPSIDPSRYLQATDAQARSFAESRGLAGARLLLTVARLQERKGHDTVLRALPLILQRFPDVHYLVVGNGDTARLGRLARECGVADHFSIVSSLDEDALASAYRACALNVMVSRAEGGEAEGFGMVYLEAGAAGRASVSGDAGGSPEVVLHGQTGLVVDARSPEQTAAAVIELLDDPARLAQMGLAAQRRVVEQFSNEKFLQTIKAACEKWRRAPS
jgi:phosphatidylinositol alpha-1,6-mannosyltransferase